MIVAQFATEYGPFNFDFDFQSRLGLFPRRQVTIEHLFQGVDLRTKLLP